jgi:hypothetical protein
VSVSDECLHCIEMVLMFEHLETITCLIQVEICFVWAMPMIQQMEVEQ